MWKPQIMPLISTLCLRVLIVGPSFESSRPAVWVSKHVARRTEVTTNIECESVRSCRVPSNRTGMRYTVVVQLAEDMQITGMGY